MKNPEDLTGQKFNQWTALERRPNDKKSVWKCVCDCGNESWVRANCLKKGYSTKCSQCSANQRKGTANLHSRLTDLSDQRFGHWIVIKRIGSNHFRRALWLCKCDCGTFKKVTASDLLRGVTTSCTLCGNYEGIQGKMWCSIVNGAKTRNLEFNISKEYIWQIWVKQEGRCALTGINLILQKRSTDHYTASLDRIDSSKGYIEGNVQWVHTDVNRMKWVFTHQEFIDICNMVSRLHPYNEETYLNKYSVWSTRIGKNKEK